MPLWKMEYASLYIANAFATTASTIIKTDSTLSDVVATTWGSLRVMIEGKMKPRQAAAVAPVNWKASQMLGMKFAAKKVIERSNTDTNANLQLSLIKLLLMGKMRPSKLRRRA